MVLYNLLLQNKIISNREISAYYFDLGHPSVAVISNSEELSLYTTHHQYRIICK